MSKNPAWEIEDKNSSIAREILEKEGFKNIVRMPRLCLYDYEAEKDGEKVYVETRCRSEGYAPYFTFKRGKLKRLQELKKETGRKVYVLLFQGQTYRLVELDEFPGSSLVPFKVVMFGKKVPAIRFRIKGELTDEEKAKILELRRKGLSPRAIAETLGVVPETVRKYLPAELRKIPITKQETRQKTGILKIRCSSNTVRVWRELLRKYQDAGLKAEDLLLDALQLIKEHNYPKTAPVF